MFYNVLDQGRIKWSVLSKVGTVLPDKRKGLLIDRVRTMTQKDIGCREMGRGPIIDK